MVLGEGVMGKINWARVVPCGILAGLVWIVLSSITTAFVASDFVAAVSGARLSAPTDDSIVILFIVNLVMGIWAMWLYAAIRPRYGPGPKTAVVAGFSWWVIGSLIDATWACFGFVVPRAVLASMAGSLPAIIIAAVVGARLYRE